MADSSFTTADSERKKEWSHGEICRLISEYEEMPCLWDTRAKGYRDKTVRAQAVRNLAVLFNVTEEDIKWKVHGLRNQFCGELRKLEKKRVNPDDENFCSKWIYFQSLKFLLNGMNIGRPSHREIKDNEEHEIEVHFTEVASTQVCLDTMLPRSPPPNSGLHVPTTPAAHRPKRKQVVHEEYLERSSFVPKTESESDLDIFGKFVVAELKSLKSESVRKRVKRIIQRVILDAQEEDDAETLYA